MTTTVADVPEALRVDFDIYDPSLAHPVDRLNEEVQRLAEIGPVVWSETHGGHWIVTRYAEAQDVLRNPEQFSSWPGFLEAHESIRVIPMEIDPPDHAGFRQALQSLFSPTRMRELETQIRSIVGELLDGFAGAGEVEFVSAFARELPARVFLALMGWPIADAPMFSEASEAFLLGKPGASAEEADAAHVQGQIQLFNYFSGVVSSRRDQPGSDVTQSIMDTPVALSEGTRILTDVELYVLFFALLIAGMHTVRGSLSWSMIHLSSRPEERQRLVDDPSLIPTAVEELLRIETAVSVLRRATSDVELGGVTIKADDRLLVVLAAANRDSSEFAAPDELHIDRFPNRHLAFGSGVHRCIGSHLARIELRIALEEIHRRIPDYWVDPERETMSHSSQVRGVVTLPLRFTPEPSAAAG